MRAEIAVTDLTRMQGQRICLAGYSPPGACIRPVLRVGGLMEFWLRRPGNRIIRPFAVIELDLQAPTPEPPHTEDWLIDPFECEILDMLAPDEQISLLDKSDSGAVSRIFGADIHTGPGWYVKAGQGGRSLGTVKPGLIEEVSYALGGNGNWEYRLAFVDAIDQRYRLAVTDLAFRYYLDHLRLQERLSPQEAARSLLTSLQEAQVFLRIGLTRGWQKYPDRCYLQITGVHSFPDYLGGRCFADFAPPSP